MTTIAEAPLWQNTVNRLAPFLLPGQYRKNENNGAACLPLCGGLPSSALERLGPLQIRLAAAPADVKQSQRLRYRVFYEEMSATAKPWSKFTRRDSDSYDAVCDHLLVEDCASLRRFGRATVVGSYRLLRGQEAASSGGFYSETEFDLGNLRALYRPANILELGRSCVLPAYRNKRTIELLWRGIWKYVQAHRSEVLIGCASFEGTDIDKLALPLSFLHHYASAPVQWQVRAKDDRSVPMNLIAKDRIDPKAAMRELPPLIKGYLRVGAFVGTGAVIDCSFNTTDVFMILPVASIGERYVQYFGSNAERRAA